MPIFKLEHLKALGYTSTSKQTAPSLPADLAALASEGAVVVTFRAVSSRFPHKVVKRVSATERFSWIKAANIVTYGLETDSPFAPLILWDIAHSMEIGSTITMVGDPGNAAYLSRAYFSGAFNQVGGTAGHVVWKKEARLPAEQDVGLDAWTFGIPVGPEDATLLNVVVARILELNVPRKEILLCGRPGDNFKYFDHVRIVGEDITAPPVKICEKKNRLAEEATWPNLCIIHDRVFLPENFHEIVNQFGDFFPLTTMQSLFFDDKCNFIPRRYSDVGVSHRVRGQSERGVMRNEGVERTSEFAPSVLALTERSGFFSGNPLRYSETTYPTGSMYLCKKSVWLSCPQNESLHWIEFEDLEHAFRAADNGIPSRVNPFGVTQSLVSRPLLSRVTGTFIENAKGKARLVRAWTEILPFARKPAIKISTVEALEAMARFAAKYVPHEIRKVIPAASAERSSHRMVAIVNLLSRVRVPMQAPALRAFVRDFEKWVVFDQLPFSWTERVVHRLLADHVEPVQALLLENDVLLNHVALRPKGSIFFHTPADYLQKRTALLCMGTWFSAFHLFRRRRDVLYLKGGPLFYFRALMLSTPFDRG
ncbi:hypothetical protein [Paraburkholderia silvatlantica]|uniref:hypothetical protein n=1 Tax=Paraburkholderia silvatlantica TaxID=321895 RepID=UPI0010616D2F|nr:hypothetical protein [Paraburkholderia silvatlantica]TDQ92427.1 hypothetical protein C7412_112203 [Paraburkholderia silvatlantica]